MSDIVHWLRKLADLVEAGHAPQHVVQHMRAGADEIERLRARLEIDPSHPYDGIYARDETIRGLEKQIASLLNLLADARTESMKLRAALREAYEVYAGSDGFIPETAGEGYQQQIIRQMVDCISAALEEGRT